MHDTPPNHLHSPLHNLRVILGNADGPLDQDRFALLVGVPDATLRAIESGQRLMSVYCQTKIHRQTGATWNEDSQIWTYDGTGRPFTRSEYQHFQDQLSQVPDPEWYLEQFRLHAGTIHELFKDCPAQQWKTLSLAIHDALAEVRKTVVSAH
jgi:hypothetical protein